MHGLGREAPSVLLAWQLPLPRKVRDGSVSARRDADGVLDMFRKVIDVARGLVLPQALGGQRRPTRTPLINVPHIAAAILLTLTPSSVAGGNGVIGKATLECNAGPGSIVVGLASNNSAVADPVTSSMTVPGGVKYRTFDVTTSPVLTSASAIVAAAANGTSKTKKLTVTPAAVVSPSSLKFGSVSVGQTSAPRTATLTNKGASPFSVSGITLTATSATWFGMTDDCPTDLAVGASCRIAVTFKPLAASSKSAKLSIATSATATPLSVSLSGTGL